MSFPVRKRVFVLTSLGLWLSISAILAGCASAPTKPTVESDLLPREGAVVELGSVSVKAGEKFQVDAPGMLRDAFERALTEEKIKWSGDPATDLFLLDVQIVDYEMGNAFKRWLLPGYGSTILAVKGELKEVESGALALSFEHKRGVYAGGAFTIGAWRMIFQSVADDIARELKIRIDGKGLVVNLPPRSAKEIDIPTAQVRQRLKIERFVDRQETGRRIGEREAAFGVSMGNVYLSRDIADVVREAIADELQGAGHTLVDSGQDITVSGEIIKFWVETKTTVLYWDVIGAIEVKLTLESPLPGKEKVGREYSARQVQRTYVWPTETVMSQVLEACLGELISNIRSDAFWTKETGGITKGKLG